MLTMAMSNSLFLPTSENSFGFSVWCLLVKLNVQPGKLLIAETASRFDRLYHGASFNAQIYRRFND